MAGPAVNKGFNKMAIISGVCKRILRKNGYKLKIII